MTDNAFKSVFSPPPKVEPPPLTEVHVEIEAIATAYEALEPLDYAAKQRAIKWLRSKFGV
jgi:hypothetical protein